jgi:membrane fusion protein (multidrug efflux system)
VASARASVVHTLDASYQVNQATYNNITGMSSPQFYIPISGPPSQENTSDAVFGSSANLLLNWDIFTFGQRSGRLRLRIAVPEALTGVALKENKVQFFTKANPEKSFEAVLTRKSGSLDISTRTEIREFEVDNKDNTLKAGTFANVNLKVSREQPSFTVPFSAVVTTLER